MPENTAARELIEASAALRTEVGELSDKVCSLAASNEKLTLSDERQRHGIIALALGGTMLLLMLAAVIVALVRVDSASDRLDSQETVDVQACERGNDTRAAQRQQWLDARKLLVALGAGAETRALADGLVANASKNFPHLDCSAIRRGEQPEPMPLVSPAAR